jgi:hypothetical protein
VDGRGGRIHRAAPRSDFLSGTFASARGCSRGGADGVDGSQHSGRAIVRRAPVGARRGPLVLLGLRTRSAHGARAPIVSDFVAAGRASGPRRARALRNILGHSAGDGLHRRVLRARADVRQRRGVPVGHLSRWTVPVGSDGARPRVGWVRPTGAGPGARRVGNPGEQGEDGRGQVPRALRADDRALASVRPGSGGRGGAVAHIRALGRQGNPPRTSRPRDAPGTFTTSAGPESRTPSGTSKGR